MNILNIAFILKDTYIADLISSCNNYKIDTSPNNVSNYDLLIIDDVDLKSKITHQANMPIIYIGDKTDINNLIHLEKPFKITDLIEIIESIKDDIKNYLQNDYLILNKLKRKLTIKNTDMNEDVVLTEKEADFIEFLLINKSEVSKKDLLKDIWNYNIEDTHTIETLVYRLRQKLQNNSNLIQTTEYGYKLKSKDF